MCKRATAASKDMTAVVHMVKPGPKTHTFTDYSKDIKAYEEWHAGQSSLSLVLTMHVSPIPMAKNS